MFITKTGIDLFQQKVTGINLSLLRVRTGIGHSQQKATGISLILPEVKTGIDPFQQKATGISLSLLKLIGISLIQHSQVGTLQSNSTRKSVKNKPYNIFTYYSYILKYSPCKKSL